MPVRCLHPRIAGSRTLLATMALACAGPLLTACQDRSVEVRVEGGLKIDDLVVGRGLPAEEGHLVEVHYTGVLPDGTKVVSTYDLEKPHRFVIGDGTVIIGMDEAVRGMRVGGVRKVRVPPRLHYGTPGYADVIPARTPLYFTIEMVRISS